MKWLVKAMTKVSVAIVASGVAVGIALTVGVAAGSNGRVAPTSSAQSTVGLTQTVPSALASSYRFLTASSSTPMPMSLARNLSAVAGGGVNPSLGREAGSVGGRHLWLVPGSTTSCLELDSGYGGCGSNALAEHQGIWLMLKPVSGAAPTMYGIVPDGATVSGRAASVTQAGDAVIATPNGSNTGQIVIDLVDGTSIDIPVPSATGSPQ